MTVDSIQQNVQSEKKRRVVFIDQARALALIMMMVGHSLDQFLGEPWRSGDTYHNYQFFRGITSALFLMVSGFSFVIASFKYWDDYTTISPRLIARLRRIGYILFLGYLLHCYGGTLAKMITRYSPHHLEFFLNFDVLQNIGISLFFLHLAAFLAKKMEHFWKIVLGLFIFILAIATITYRPDVDAVMPLWLASSVNMYHESRFPLVPFTAFMLIGAFAAYWFWEKKKTGDENSVMIFFMLTGLVFISLDVLMNNFLYGKVFPYAYPAPKLPGNTLARAGSAMLVIGTFYWLEKKIVLFPRLSFTMSKDSLAIYVVHLLIVYSGSYGLFQSYKKIMNPLQVWLFIGALFSSMVIMAYVINLTRTKYPNIVTKVRRTFILGWFIMFFIWPQNTIWSALVSLILASFFIGSGYSRLINIIKVLLSKNTAFSKKHSS